MCGICGIVGLEPAGRAEGIVRRMMVRMQHRGPDDEGLLLRPPVAAGMRRLSIIDLAGGHQPIYNEEGTVGVVLNGEIYNFQQLRSELEQLGHRFATRSDTEVIVHAWETWGADCVRRLRGMFAFAVVDTRSGGAPRLFLARDRLGIKPLYYAAAQGALVFASEVRALLASGLVEPRLSKTALESYLLFGSVGEPMTLVEGVYSLPPGHAVEIRADHPAAFQPQSYWAPSEFPAAAPVRTREEASERLRALLEDSVRLHLLADVPLGVFLSSGIDSTALAALASRERAGIHTFTVAFSEQEFSEAAEARQIAAQLGTTHAELLLSGEQMLARMDEAVAALDQPSMDGINSYFVSGAVRQAGLKVALSGLGGDEIFGGYETFLSAPRLERLGALGRWLPGPLRAAMAPAVMRLAGMHGRPDGARKLETAWRTPGVLPHAYFFTRALFLPEQVSRLARLNGSAGAAAPWRGWLDRAMQESSGWDAFRRISWLESRSYMVNTLLRDTDAVSMAHSLEVRVPLLDHPLVEFVAALPEEIKRGARPKALLIEALADLLPASVTAQPKRTFTLPWERWLRGALRPRVAAGLAALSPALAGALDGRAMLGVWKEFEAGRTGWTRPWSLYVLNEWARQHLEVAKSEAVA
jgi:asparagine synthase (glutamine-hydrolysing)